MELLNALNVITLIVCIVMLAVNKKLEVNNEEERT